MLIFCEFRLCLSNCFDVPTEIPISTWDEPIFRKIPVGWFIVPSLYLIDTNSWYWNEPASRNGGMLVCSECISRASRDINKNNESAMWLLNVIAELKIYPR